PAHARQSPDGTAAANGDLPHPRPAGSGWRSADSGRASARRKVFHILAWIAEGRFRGCSVYPSAGTDGLKAPRADIANHHRIYSMATGIVSAARTPTGSTMAKNKRLYGCSEGGATVSKWAGQCSECQAWSTLVETVVDTTPVGGSGAGRSSHWAGEAAQVKTLAEVSTEETPRQPSGSSELDRVLGGGLVSGSVVLIGGDPGIGKSTILL